MSELTFFQNLFRKSAWLYVFAFLIAPTGYIVKVIVSNDISVEELGVLYGVISLVMLLAAYNDFGMSESINYFLPEYFEKKDKKRSSQLLAYALAVQLITSTMIAVFLFWGAGFLADSYFKSEYAEGVIKIFILFFVQENIFQTLNNFFQATQNTKMQKGAEFLRMLTLMFSVIFIFITGAGGLYSYAWAWIISLFVGVCISIFWLFRTYGNLLTHSGLIFEKAFFKKLFKYAIWVVLSANVGTILGQIDMQMVIGLLGSQDAGYYTNYLSVIRIPFIFFTPGIVFLFPIISGLHAKKDYSQMKRLRNFFFKYFTVIGVMTGSFFFLYGEPLTTFLFGDKFLISGKILMYSCLFLVFNFCCQINFQFIGGTGRPKVKAQLLTIVIVFNAIMNFILIKNIGVYGAALATGMGWVLLWYLSNRQLKEIALDFDWKFFTKNLIIVAILSFFLYQYVDFEIANRYLRGVYVCGIIALYGLVFILTNPRDFKMFFVEFKKMLNDAKKKTT